MERKEQGRLNFTDGNKQFILREVAPFLPHSRMTRVLRAIRERHWQYARDENEVMLSHKEIASYDGMSVPTARRAIQDLIDFNLLIKSETVSCHGRQANSYKIVWSNLDAIVNDGEPLIGPAPVPEESTGEFSETPAPDLDYESSQVVKVASDHGDTPPDHCDHPPDHGDQPPPDHCDQASLYPSIINPPPPESNNPTWEEVEEILISEFGVGRPVPAVTAARESGCAIVEILQLIEYARSKPGAYGAGAIYTRIFESRPGRDPAQGWPDESEKYRKRQKQSKTKVKAVQAETANAEREKKIKQDQHARQLLERDFGPELDRMNREELRDFAFAHCTEFVARLIGRSPDAIRAGGLYRDELLKALKARQPDGLDNWNSAIADGPAIADRK